MKKKPNKFTSGPIAAPEAILKAAVAAPRVFSISANFRALYLMREKGHSWRYLAEWLTQFNVRLSHVHLHRLYVAEDARLDKLTKAELLKLGMPSAMIEERLARDDPNKRLVASDPGEGDSEDSE